MRSLTERFTAVPRWARIALLLVLTIPVLAACTESQGEQNRTAAVENREQIFDRAENQIPAPVPVNFPMRQALADFVERQDMVNHPWYTYLMGYDGNYIGYFVGQTYPINACNFLSSSERVRDDNDGGNLVLTAPSLDGMFYGGGGASAGCSAYFFFDVSTGAVLVFDVPAYVASDVPLALDVPRLNVASPEQIETAAGDGSIQAPPADPVATPAAVTP